MDFVWARDRVLTWPRLTHYLWASIQPPSHNFLIYRKDNICKVLKILLGKKQSGKTCGLLILSHINSPILVPLARGTHQPGNPDLLSWARWQGQVPGSSSCPLLLTSDPADSCSLAPARSSGRKSPSTKRNFHTPFPFPGPRSRLDFRTHPPGCSHGGREKCTPHRPPGRRGAGRAGSRQTQRPRAA